jgi:hypothetical protein
MPQPDVGNRGLAAQKLACMLDAYYMERLGKSSEHIPFNVNVCIHVSRG